jgi:hypothetical protein
MELKWCDTCKKWKKLEEFGKQKRAKDGLRYLCKKCNNKKGREWAKENSEKVNERSRKWYKENIEKVKITSKKYREKNVEKIKKQKRKHYCDNFEIYKEKSKKYREEHVEIIKEQNKRYRKENVEKLKKKEKKYRERNVEKIKEKNKKYHEKNKEKLNEASRQYKKENIGKVRESYKQFQKDHPEKYRKTQRECRKKRALFDVKFRLKCCVSSNVGSRLRKRLLSKEGKSTWDFLPYTVEELIQHLEKLFEPWMNWKNYGNKKGCWNIDHRIPDSSFNYSSVEDEEFQKCWALENLQPLDAIENIKKGNKLIY